MRWLMLFIAVPLLEIWLLIKVGGRIGASPTIALVVLTAVVGVALLRLQGLTTLMRASARLRSGQLPAQEIGEGVILALAGVLLLTPGFATDAVGFACLVPALRRRLLAPWLRGVGRSDHRHRPERDNRNSPGRTLEGDYRRDPDDEHRH